MEGCPEGVGWFVSTGTDDIGIPLGPRNHPVRLRLTPLRWRGMGLFFLSHAGGGV